MIDEGGEKSSPFLFKPNTMKNHRYIFPSFDQYSSWFGALNNSYINIEPLIHLPQKVSGGKEWGWDGKKQRRSWNKMCKNLNKVSLHKYIGHYFDKIYAKYKDRLPEDFEHTPAQFCFVLGLYRGIWIDGVLYDIDIRWGWRKIRADWYWGANADLYVDMADGIIKKIPKSSRKKKLHLLSKEERMTKKAEQKRDKRKRRKENKQRAKEHGDYVLDKMRLMDAAKRKNEREQNLLKILRHGFDPLTSFRTNLINKNIIYEGIDQTLREKQS